MSIRKPYNDRAGYRCSMRSAPRGGWVVVYDAAAQGLDDSAGKWATVCETHSTIMNSSSEKKARLAMKAPSEWCASCYEAGE